MRSLLFVPGDSEKKLAKGFQAKADIVIVDLEDSVAPDAKAAARDIACQFIVANRTTTTAALYVRYESRERVFTAGNRRIDFHKVALLPSARGTPSRRSSAVILSLVIGISGAM